MVRPFPRAPSGAQTGKIQPMRQDEPHRLGTAAIYGMATAAGIAVANIYYNQPMLERIEADLPGPYTALVPMATQLGYAAGLFLLVPLGDVVERRKLIVAQFLLLTLALAGAALAPSGAMLALASLVVGLMASVAQQIVPSAAHLVAPERRGAVIGTILAGILTGILLSRTIAGFIATHAGWREMFWIGVPAALVAGGLIWRLLPKMPATSDLGYLSLLASLGRLWREFPALRLAALTQSLLFASFSVFWTVLAFRLQAPPFGYGPDVAGLFGIVGMVGILAAPIAGRYADRKAPQPVVLAGAVLTIASWLVFGFWPGIAGLVVGIILLDFATQSALVSNQHIAFALRPEARARLNTLVMGTMFLGGAVGSATGMFAWSHFGWAGVCLWGAVLGLLAVLLQLKGRAARH